MLSRPRSKRVSGLILAAVLFGGGLARADGEKNSRYHFQLTSVTAKPAVKPDAAKLVTPAVEAELRKVLAEHPQVVVRLDGAPDPKGDAEAYRSFLAKNRISGAYRVSVQIKEAVEKVVPADEKSNAQRLEVRLVLHMVGDKIPDGTIGFNGHGNATIKQEVGAQVREQDRKATWKDAAEVVVADAMKRALEELAAPPKVVKKAGARSR